MLPTTALQRLAYYASGVTGLYVHYPAPGTIASPAMVLYWDESLLTESAGEQLWMLTVKGQLLTSLKGNVAGEILVADTFIAPLADAFTSDGSNHAAFHLQTDDGTDRVDYCRLERTAGGDSGVEYAGHLYYGAELFFGIKLRRFAGS
jgi:hypothetical protein